MPLSCWFRLRSLPVSSHLVFVCKIIFEIQLLIIGMDTVDKLFFVFNAYDFNSSGSLCYDELSLLLRSAVKGLQKVCPDVPVFNLATSVEVEAYADLIFASAGLVAPKGPSTTAGKNDKIRV